MILKNSPKIKAVFSTLFAITMLVSTFLPAATVWADELENTTPENPIVAADESVSDSSDSNIQESADENQAIQAESSEAENTDSKALDSSEENAVVEVETTTSATLDSTTTLQDVVTDENAESSQPQVQSLNATDSFEETSTMEGASLAAASISTCPFVAGANKTIVNFNTKPTGNPESEGKIFVTKAKQFTSTLPATVSLPSGKYKVSLYFYDSYQGRAVAVQPNEKWFIRFFDSSNNIITTSAVSSDLQDGVDTATKIEVVNQSLNISSNVTKVTGVHVDYNNPGSVPSQVSYGSLAPVCASFEKINTPVNTPPTITLVGSNPIEITQGDVFVDPGATAQDAEDGNLTSQIVKTGSVNNNTVGTYTLNYSVTDSGGLSASTTRTVIVKPNLSNISQCPFTPSANTKVAVFDTKPTGNPASEGKIFVTNAKQYVSTLPNNISLAPGQYKVSLYFYDSFVGRDHDSQPNEKWFVSLYNNADDFVAMTNVSSDLEDNVTTASKAEVVNQNLIVNQNVKYVIGWHVDYNNPGSVPSQVSYGSLAPVCASFEKINTPVNTPPTITLIGANPLEITVNTPFVDPGATANDAEDGDLTSQIVKTGSVDNTIVGNYTLTYSVTDSGGLSTSTTRTVVVKPAGCTSNCGGGNTPTVSLVANPTTISKSGTSTLSWTSTNTNSCSAAWTTSTSTSGSTIVTLSTTTSYSISCVGSNGSVSATTTVTVSIVNTPPTITLIGNNPFTLVVNNAFIDPGATANDAEDGNLTNQIVKTGTVNASTTGSYTLTYSVTDSGGLSTSTTRTVIVIPANSTPAVCSDNLDNDGDSKVDTYDPGCHTDNDPNNPNSYDPNDNDETDVTPPSNPPVNPPGGGGGIGGRRHPVLISTGEVLGATSCSYLRDYLKMGWNNDPIEVLKLQSFLNIFEKENLALSGNFDKTTFAAVERFQNKYFGDILEPWGHTAPTGFVYILTKKKVNEIYCNTLINLNQADKDEIASFRALLETLKANGGYVDGANNAYRTSTSTNVLDNVLENSTTTVSTSTIGATENNDSNTDSVMKNAAISLFAWPKKMYDENKYLFILLILILIAIIVSIVRLFTGSDDDASNNPPQSIDSSNSSVINLPGTKEGEEKKESEFTPEEEIIIVNEEEKTN